MTLKSLHFVFKHDPENYGLMLSYLKTLGVTIDLSKGTKARNFMIQAETVKLLHVSGYIDDSLEQNYRSEAQKAISEFEEAKRRCDELFGKEIKEIEEEVRRRLNELKQSQNGLESS